MSNFHGTLSLGVLAVHGNGCPPTHREDLRVGVAALLAAVEIRMRPEHPSIRLNSRIGSAESAYGVAASTPALALVDLTHADEKIAAFIGQMLGLGVPCVFLCQVGVDGLAAKLNFDGAPVFRYRALRVDLEASQELQQEVRGAISTQRIVSEMVHQLWFPRSTKTIWVVCPQIHNPGEFGDRSSPDYTYLDNLGDTDALLELMVFLARHYPGTTIGYFNSGDLPPGHTSGNLVVIGGPGSASEIGNHTCREMMGAVRSRVSYSEDCDYMIVTAGPGDQLLLRADVDLAEGGVGVEGQGIRRDCGYFARCPNPLNEDADIVLVNGIHTRGVLGAGRAFADKREALRNYHAVFASGVDPKRFECHFEVRVVSGNVQVPEVLRANIFPLASPASTVVEQLSEAPTRSPTTPGQSSVTIVFVAGDRGGSHLAQVQIVREIEGIQAAIQACKHRDAITFALPVQAASSKKVAAASRNRPAIMHFAGHGSDRSLSFISDENLLVNAIPVSAAQLAEILRAFPTRVTLCVLNTCSSASIADSLVRSGVVRAAVGWQGRVSDTAAIAFSSSLYGYLGDGESLVHAVTLAGVSGEEDARPLLYLGQDFDGSAPLVQGPLSP